MAKRQSRTPQVHTTAREMGQAGWQPLLAPLPISSPPHHVTATPLLPLFAYTFACAVVAATILWLFHFVNGSLW
jgi:hypothetical protein